jgi:hypothetical protein
MSTVAIATAAVACCYYHPCLTRTSSVGITIVASAVVEARMTISFVARCCITAGFDIAFDFA